MTFCTVFVILVNEIVVPLKVLDREINLLHSNPCSSELIPVGQEM